MKPLILVLTAFFALKIPVLFCAVDPEELRDFTAYMQVAQGLLAYRDFAWHYGPFSVLFFGYSLKIFPQVLLTLRVLSLLISALGAWGVYAILTLYFRSTWTLVLSTLLCCALFAFPNYTFSHVPATVAIIWGTYFVIRYYEKPQEKFLYYSFACVALAVFARPMLTGFAVLTAWIGFFVSSREKNKLKVALYCAGTLLACFGAAFLIFGSHLKFGFLTSKNIVLFPENYPNLHFIFQIVMDPNPVVAFFKTSRAALEVIWFYLQVFVLPAIALTLALSLWSNARIRAAVICMIVSFIGSLDLIHYGFEHPDLVQVFSIRAQYFFPLTGSMIFLLIIPVLRSQKVAFFKVLGARIIVLLVGYWAVLHWGYRIRQVATFPINPSGFKVYTALVQNPDSNLYFDAATWLNSRCSGSEKMAVWGYAPIFSVISQCEDIYARDQNLFQRNMKSRTIAGESPYYPEGGLFSHEIAIKMLEEEKPTFVVTPGMGGFAKRCVEENWSYKDFTSGDRLLRICWKDNVASRKR